LRYSFLWEIVYNSGELWDFVGKSMLFDWEIYEFWELNLPICGIWTQKKPLLIWNGLMG